MPAQDQRKELEKIALELLVRVGALQRCPLHADQYFEGAEEPRQAYKIATAKIRDGEILLPPSIPYDKFMDLIKAIHKRYFIDTECEQCAEERYK